MQCEACHEAISPDQAKASQALLKSLDHFRRQAIADAMSRPAAPDYLCASDLLAYLHHANETAFSSESSVPY